MGNPELIIWAKFISSTLSLLAWVYIDARITSPKARTACKEGRLEDAVIWTVFSWFLFCIITLSLGWFGITLFDHYELKMVWPF